MGLGRLKPLPRRPIEMYATRIAIASLLALIFVTPVSAQVPKTWTQAGMLTCRLNPSIGFIIAGHQSMECRYAPSDGSPPQAYEGALNTVGIDIGISAGEFSAGQSLPRREASRLGARRRICRGIRRSWHRDRRRRQRIDRRLGTNLRTSTAVARRFNRSQRRAWRFRAQVAAGDVTHFEEL